MNNLIKTGKLIMILTGLIIMISCCPTEATTAIPGPTTVQAAIMHPAEDFSSVSCSECHADATPDIYTAWKESGHGKMDYGCYICHGDGVVEFHPMASTEGCVSCHSNNESHLARHEYEGCFDCHNAHSLSAN